MFVLRSDLRCCGFLLLCSCSTVGVCSIAVQTSRCGDLVDVYGGTIYKGILVLGYMRDILVNIPFLYCNPF